MLKNQGFIYITHSQLKSAPLIKLNYEPRKVLPTGFVENYQALALWPITCNRDNGHTLLDELHASLIRNGLAFTIPKVYQTSLSQFVSYIDQWIEVDRHFQGINRDNFEIVPDSSNYIPESSINMEKLGQAWLTHDPSYEACASSAFYRGMLSGEVNCQLQMARCYAEGVGVDVDFTRARELLSPIKNHDEVFPLLLRISYIENNSKNIVDIKNDFFSKVPLPLPGKNDLYGSFHQTLLSMLWVSYEQAGHLDIWLSNWELISPYREEILALSEVRVLDNLDTPEASQTLNFHDILTQTFQSYRLIA